MDNKQLFQKHYNRLRVEGIIKALVFGLIIGFAVDFVIAFITWFTPEFNGLWLALCVFVAVTAGSTVLLYFKKFKPTTKQVAARIDRLGLEERMITMAELENDESYIAMLQREDAKAKLSSVDSKRIRFKVSAVAIVAVAILAVSGISMTTVTALSADGKIASGKEIIRDITADPDKFYEVSYLIEGEGYIEGDPEQVVKEGESSTPVLAVAEDGWAFAYWDDGSGDENPPTEPERFDENVRENIVWTAVFMELEEGDGDGDGDGEGEPSDSDSDAPGEPGDPSDEDSSNGEPKDPADGDPGNGSNGSSGSDKNDNNSVIDGDTYYGDVYDDFHSKGESDMDGDGLPGDHGDFVGDYWDILH